MFGFGKPKVGSELYGKLQEAKMDEKHRNCLAGDCHHRYKQKPCWECGKPSVRHEDYSGTIWYCQECINDGKHLPLTFQL